MTKSPFALPDFELILCQGIDAEAFLQAQLSNDVRELGERNAQWSALLSPQGRVQALVVLLRLDPQQFVLGVPHRRGTALLEILQKFVLRRKLKLSIDSGRCVYGAEDANASDGLIRLELTLGDGRCLLLGPTDAPSAPPPTDWSLRDLEAGIPWLPEAAAERHLPHALALDKRPAISLKKGCYPGQEIVARTHYLGRNKRVLCLLESTEAPGGATAGTQIRDGENQLAGELIHAVAAPAGTMALAVLSQDRCDGMLIADPQGELQHRFKLIKQF